MEFQRLVAVIRKELVQTLRDRRTLIIQLLGPILLLFLFGYAVEIQVDNQPTVVVDMSRDQRSLAYVNAMVNTGYFRVIGYASSEQEAVRAIDDGRARVAIIIPPGFSAQIERGQQPQVLVLIDGSEVLGSQSALNATLTTAQHFGARLLAERIGRTPLAGQARGLQPLDVRFRVLYNPNMESIFFMIPGLIGLLLQQQTLLLTAFSIVREKEVGTVEQILVTPIRPWELMLGKMVPNVLVSFINMTTILLLGIFWFNVPVAGNIWLFFLLALLFIFTSLGFGIFISTISTSQKQAQEIARLLVMPAMMLSGFMFPREAMPPVLQWIGTLIPVTYFLRISRGIITKGVGFDALHEPVLVLALFGVLVFFASSRTFRTRLD